MYDSIDEAIKAKLAESQSILIVSHIRPDGDAVGSLLGLGLALIRQGKAVQLVLADGLPDKYLPLRGSDLVRKIAQGEFDMSIVVDCSDIERTGSAFSNISKPDLNIDHHKTNLNFAALNLVEADSVATAATLAEHMPSWGLEIDCAVASCLLTGIIADTIGFRTSNMSAQALRLSADLIDKGADLSKLYRQTLVSRSFEAIGFWGAGLNRLGRDGAIVWASLTLDDRGKIGYPDDDDADLIDILAAIGDAKIAIIFVEHKNGSIKVSWRAQKGFDVSGIALSFGGGGHAGAAGVDIQGDLTEVMDSVIQATKVFLAETLAGKKILVEEGKGEQKI
ncbi:MAG: DHH family phosphoesterase [Chloroflexota bacterium]